MSTREIIINARKGDCRYCVNKVHTSKYTLFTFLPLFLYDQFSKPSNMFFLTISLLQQIPGLSPTGRWGTLIPLITVLSVSACKEIYEDRKRRMADEEGTAGTVNSSKALIIDNEGFEAEKWEDLRVGQIVKVLKNEPLPADLVLLASSEPDGFCYIETANIDGESNLKLRQARNETLSFTSLNDCTLTCAPPNEKIYSFEGSLQLNSMQISLSREQMLPRGSVLKNISWIIGLVVYTGHETKIFMNANEPPRKSTKMEKLADFQTVYIIAMLLLMISICFVFNFYYETSVSYRHLYLSFKMPSSFFIAFWKLFANVITFLLLFNNLVPISLAITMEALRFQLAELINSDQELYDQGTDCFANAKSSNLLEELGQIEYILTDKTGTLTRNEMVLKHVVISGSVYRDCTESNSQFRSAAQEYNSKIQMFLENLLNCHSVMIDRSSCNETSICYQASSPDELGIIQAMKKLGLVLCDRSASSIEIDWNGCKVAFRVLAVIEFTSERRMMSVLVQRPEGGAVLFCKGADLAISSKLSSSCKSSPYFSSTLKSIDKFAIEGLRTLCYAYREITQAQAQNWLCDWQAAINSVVDRQGAIDLAAAKIECGLQLSGAVAIEDRLQAGVSDAIATLIKANIKIWMLTGDRTETAINAGYLSGLLTPETNLLNLLIDENVVQNDSIVFSKHSLDNSLTNSDDDIFFLKRAFDEYKRTHLARHAIVINGSAFELLRLSPNPEVMQKFAELCSKCSTLIACRLSPIQKSQIAEIVKFRFKKTVLAIGDGGNDVGMIQAANVGVGITGLEGMQAARSSDFTIAKFPLLAKLLLVHGSWALHRVSRVVLYANYKNLALFMCQFWFAALNMFSGQSVAPSKLLMLYNLIFTAAPPIILGLTEQYVPAACLLKHPQLYSFGQRGKFYDNRAFLTCLAGAVFTSLLVFLCYCWILSEGNVFGNGFVLDNFFGGSLLYFIMLLTVSVKLLFYTNFITIILVISVVASIAAWFIVFLSNTSSVVVFTSPYVWASLLLIPIVGNLRDFSWKFYRRIFRPRPYHIVQEMDSLARDHPAKLAKASKAHSPSQAPLTGSFSQSGESSMTANLEK